MKKKLLWVGDGGCGTGFARITHNVLDRLPQYDRNVLALNYYGDPHEYDYKLYPASSAKHRDYFGLDRLPEVMQKVEPDLVVVQNDPWNFEAYFDILEKMESKVPVVIAAAVDGKNMMDAPKLNKAAHGIFWTQFGLDEAIEGGFTQPGSVIPLGVDLKMFYPMQQRDARLNILPGLGLDKAFIVGNVNRNQPRKRFDLTVKYFAEWVKEYKIDNAFLFLHVASTGDKSVEVYQLMQYYGFRGKNKRLILSAPEQVHGVSNDELRSIYNCFDVQVNTGTEGWGLTNMEGMACGIPQIVNSWAALAEWPEGNVTAVPTSGTQIGPPYSTNVISGVPDEELFVNALQSHYEDAGIRRSLGAAGEKHVRSSKFNWDTIAKQYDAVFTQVLNGL